MFFIGDPRVVAYINETLPRNRKRDTCHLLITRFFVSTHAVKGKQEERCASKYRIKFNIPEIMFRSAFHIQSYGEGI